MTEKKQKSGCATAFFWFIGIIIFIFFVMFLLPDSNNNTDNANDSSELEASYNSLPFKKIPAAIKQVALSAINNNAGIDGNIQIIEVDHKFSVIVAFEGNQNILTNSQTRFSIKQVMSAVYYHVFKDFPSVRHIYIEARYPALDAYGNNINPVVYATYINGEVRKRINWEQDKFTLEVNIIPHLWTVATDFPQFMYS